MRNLLTVPAIVLGMAVGALAQEPDRWLHVRVENSGEKAEIVRVNLPLSLAEKVLPTIHTHELAEGKVKIKGKVKDVDLRALLEAVRSAGDNEFVTVESASENVRVAKSGEYLLVQVREGENKSEKVDIKVPVAVVEALLSAGEDELDLVAGIRALSAHGDTELVTVTGKSETVRIWVDSRNTSE